MRNRNSLSYPGNDIKIFVRWYKAIMSKVDKKQHEKIIKVKWSKTIKDDIAAAIPIPSSP